jgi:hypothetical protein
MIMNSYLQISTLAGLVSGRRLACLAQSSGPLPDLGLRCRSGENASVDKAGGFDNFWGMNRLTIEIEPEQHRQIKTLATFAGMTMKEFILSKTLTPPSVQSSPSQDTTSRLLGSPRNAKRLREAISAKTPKHLIFETTEDLKRALGI